MCEWLLHIVVKYGGLVVTTLGIALIVFCGLTFIVCVTPAITQAYSWGWCALHYIALFYMFQILFNYICAIVFSAHLGSNYRSNGCSNSSHTCYVINHDECTRGNMNREMHQFTTNNDQHEWKPKRNWQQQEEKQESCSEQEEEQCQRNGYNKLEQQHETSTLVELHEEIDAVPINTITWSWSKCKTWKVWFNIRKKQLTKLLAYLNTSFWHNNSVDKTVLLELEAIAHSTEALPFHERRFVLLDKPRRFCDHCQRLKAPREHHCKMCNRCVAKMDHHCPWINNCVDLENEKYFLLFLVHLWTACGIVCVILCGAFWRYALPSASSSSSMLSQLASAGSIEDAMNIINNNKKKNNLMANAQTHLIHETEYEKSSSITAEFAFAYIILNSFPVFLLFALSIVVCVFLGILLLMHLRDVCKGITPIERLILRDYFYRARCAKFHSPYDLGSKWRNVLEVLQRKDDKWVIRYWQHKENIAQHNCNNNNNNNSSSFYKCTCNASYHKYVNKCKEFAIDVAFFVWLVSVPSLQSSGKDGLHYRTFNQEVQHYTSAKQIHQDNALANQM